MTRCVLGPASLRLMFWACLGLSIATVPLRAAAEDADADASATAQEQPAEATAAPSQEDAAKKEEIKGLGKKMDAWFGEYLVGPLWKYFLGVPVLGVPLIIIVLVIGAVFFTARFSLVNVRLFRHSIDCIRGKFDNPDDKGEISHFKALSSALSATVGLGNIAGVAVAIAAGGPGAVFWMWVVAFCGMNMKFSSCTLSQLYRRIKPDGSILGGPMVYLDEGLTDVSPRLKPLAKALAIVFSVVTIIACFGGGNMFQGKMTYAISAKVVGRDSDAAAWIFGVILALLVGVVIIGGIKRIGEVTSRLVPTMCLFYCSVCIIIILANITRVPSLLASIVMQAFSPDAIYGGFLGVLIIGMTRAAFSNEAGIGSAAIAHAAAKTDEPVREGVVAMVGPFIDTIVVCTMTALAILITRVHEGKEVGTTLEGAVLTADAFRSLHSVFAYLLIPAVFIFAYSTMISWSYYGERATEYLVGEGGILPFRIIFCLLVVLGPVLSISNILDFSDLMILSMAFPNIIGMIILSGKVKRLTDDYTARLKSGEMQPSAAWLEKHPGDAPEESAAQ